MKLRKYLIVLICFLLLFPCIAVGAAQSTAYTYTISVDGNWIRTQDAYISSRIYLKNAGLSNPQDLFIFGDMIYVADTGNARIVIINRDTLETDIFKYEEFVAPSGIFVAKDKTLYVADPNAEAIFIFSPDGELLRKISRPESVIFGKESMYQPKKISVSSQENIFVVGEGAFEGIMQFDSDGVFQGYFAANKRELTAFERMEEFLLNEDQIESLVTKKPPTIQNICIDDRDLIYSVTQSNEGTTSEHNVVAAKTFNCIKRHNMAGTNILSTDTFMDDEWNFVDVAAGQYDNFFAITYTGIIYEYDSAGNVLFSFGGRALENDTYGLLAIASAIDIDKNGIIYALDSERGIIQTFVPTDFATVTHKAIYCMNSGNYTDSEEIWQSVLNLNGMSKIAHMGLGRTLFRQQRYSEALEHFKFAGDRDGYSECYWELRDKWITDNMLWIIIAFVVIISLLLLFSGKKKKVSTNIGRVLLESEGRVIKRFATDVKFSKYMLTHPIDGYYYLKRGIKGSVVSATILYLISFLAFALDNMAKAFIFNTSSLSESFLTVVSLFFASVILWNMGNYMVSTINEGEGSFKNIYIMTAYALMPYWLFTVIKVVISYALTSNEAFVLTVLSVLGIAWSAILLVTGLIEIHNYSFKETVKNIVLTVFAMLLAIVAVAIMYLIWTQLISFLKELFMEVTYIV